jgi:hypothetical protein
MNSKPSSKKSGKQSRKPKNVEVGEIGEEICLGMASPLMGDDVKEAPFPLGEMTVDEMLGYLIELREKFPNYDMYFKIERAPKFFGELNWWELKGVRRV